MTVRMSNTVATVNTVVTAAATTSLNGQGTSLTALRCTQTRRTTITPVQSSTAAQNAAIEMRMKTRMTGATGRMEEARLAAGCLEVAALALRGAVSAQTEGTPTHIGGASVFK